MEVARPSIPVLTAAKSDSLTIEWIWSIGSTPDKCQVCYRCKGDRTWLRTTMQGAFKSITIGGLTPDTAWEFKLRGVGKGGNAGEFSPTGGPHRTLTSRDDPAGHPRRQKSTAAGQQRPPVAPRPPSYQSQSVEVNRGERPQQVFPTGKEEAAGRGQRVDKAHAPTREDVGFKTGREFDIPKQRPEGASYVPVRREYRIPSIRRFINVGTDSITLQVELQYGITRSLIYHQQCTSKFIILPIRDGESTFKVSNLTPDTHYEFKVRETGPGGVDVDSPYTAVKTKFCAKYYVDTHSVETRMKKGNNSFSVQKLTLEKLTHCDTSMTRILQFGPPRMHREKTLMLVGATGAGKSTLLDGMVNYLLGVGRGDRQRYTIIDNMDNEENKNVTESQTEWITLYKINAVSPDRVSASINIIDTPGFGDTRGLQRDKELIEQIREFFNKTDDMGVKMLDAVCFVGKATEARLTTTQKYICESVLSVFGKDIAENVTATLTFCDGSEPVALAALRKSDVPFDKYFQFNNSALFESLTNDSVVTNMYWELGQKNFTDFFNAIEQMTPKSLVLTAEVLEERRTLDFVTNGLVYSMEDCLKRLHNLSEEEAAMKDDRKELRSSKQLTHSVKEFETKQKKLKRGRATNCLQCNMTCHANCSIKDDAKLYRCDAMKTKHKNENTCVVCPRHCPWNQHVSMGYQLVRNEITVTQTDAVLKARHKNLQEGIHARKEVIDQINKEIYDVMNEITGFVKELKRCRERLCEIALRPNPMSDTGFIDMLILQEQNEAKEGFLDRINGLRRVKEQALLFNDVKAMSKFQISS